MTRALSAIAALLFSSLLFVVCGFTAPVAGLAWTTGLFFCAAALTACGLHPAFAAARCRLGVERTTVAVHMAASFLAIVVLVIIGFSAPDQVLAFLAVFIAFAHSARFAATVGELVDPRPATA